VSTKFMILGATDQKLWVFEVFRRTLGRVACARTNENKLTTCAQEKGLRCEKMGGQRPRGIPWSATSDRLLAAAQLVQTGCLPMAPPPTCNFFCLLSLNFHRGSVQSILATICIQRSCMLNI
jgi:hypothetical protein